MNTLIHSFLSKSIHSITLHEGNHLSVQECQIRPFGSSFVAKGRNIRYLPEQLIYAQWIQVWLSSIAATIHSIEYTIHSSITIREIVIRIAKIPLRLHRVRIEFLCDPEPTRIKITVDEISFGSMFVIKRFHNDSDPDPGCVIQIQRDSSILIQIPEVRILSWISLSTIQTIRSELQRILPKKKGDEPMPVIHVSSIFLRYLPMRWHRCVSPISIGGSYTHIWEIWEHIVRAVTRI